jgi:uncharacterized protein (TIGR00730 family)
VDRADSVTARAVDVTDAVDELLRVAAPEDLTANRRRILRELLMNAALLAGDPVDALDLKIASAALHEMRDAFRMFAPYESVSKVTIFGSARITHDSALYGLTRELAAEMAHRGWMVVTGAGPGLMEAGMAGAGRARSIGVSIQLPWEQSANSIIAGDEKYVAMKYFFTRKLMLIKESRGFVCLPGGFGTLDETFELLTLTQTGKGLPVPIVLLEAPGDHYWGAVDRFLRDEVLSRGLVSPPDLDLYRITDSCAEAVDELIRFYANYDSIRFVGDDLVIRLRRAPDDATLADLNERFAHLVMPGGRIERTDPLPLEVRDRDALDLERVHLPFSKRGFAELRQLIDALNQI